MGLKFDDKTGALKIPRAAADAAASADSDDLRVLLLLARAAGAGRWVCLALGLALLAPVGFALLGQMAGARDGALAALNAAFFRRARMENVSACLLLGAGLFLRAALPGGEKRA